MSGKTREKFVQIGDVRFEPTLGFSASGLRYLALDGPGSCDPIEASKLQTTYENLIKEKYPNLIAQTSGFKDVTSSLSRTFRRYGNDDVHVDIGLDADALVIPSCTTLFRVRLNYQSADDSLAALARQKKQGEQSKTNALDDL